MTCFFLKPPRTAGGIERQRDLNCGESRGWVRNDVSQVDKRTVGRRTADLQIRNLLLYCSELKRQLLNAIQALSLL